MVGQRLILAYHAVGGDLLMDLLIDGKRVGENELKNVAGYDDGLPGRLPLHPVMMATWFALCWCYSTRWQRWRQAGKFSPAEDIIDSDLCITLWRWDTARCAMVGIVYTGPTLLALFTQDTGYFCGYGDQPEGESRRIVGIFSNNHFVPMRRIGPQPGRHPRGPRN